MDAGGSFPNLWVLEGVGEALISALALSLVPSYSLFSSHRARIAVLLASVLWKKEHLNSQMFS